MLSVETLLAQDDRSDEAVLPVGYLSELLVLETKVSGVVRQAVLMLRVLAANPPAAETLAGGLTEELSVATLYGAALAAASQDFEHATQLVRASSLALRIDRRQWHLALLRAEEHTLLMLATLTD